jgi:hypothetical protein
MARIRETSLKRVRKSDSDHREQPVSPVFERLGDRNEFWQKFP